MFSRYPNLVLMLAFIAGCGAAAIAPNLIPPAHAQVAVRWETRCLQVRSMDGPRGLHVLASEAGQQGWEPFQVEQDRYICFKRPAQ